MLTRLQCSGSSESYCGTGCNKDFGECDEVPKGVSDTTNGLCGSNFQAACANFGDKKCCSPYGFW